MNMGVISWWYLLCAVGTANVMAWLLVRAALERRPSAMMPEVYRLRRLQLLLCGGYVLGCAFRSVFPVYDVPRLVVVDSWLSSVLIGRSVATVAELCFAGQWALMLREFALATDSRFGKALSYCVVPLISVAETCSWYSVLTTANIGHVAEESLWGLTAALLVAGALLVLPRCAPARRPMIIAWCVAGSAYVAYMFCVDVPMYWTRWLADQAAGKHYLTIYAGILDAAQHRLVSHQWSDWKHEVVWMSLYFSVAVWISLSFVHVAPAWTAREPRRSARPAQSPWRIVSPAKWRS